MLFVVKNVMGPHHTLINIYHIQCLRRCHNSQCTFVKSGLYKKPKHNVSVAAGECEQHSDCYRALGLCADGAGRAQANVSCACFRRRCHRVPESVVLSDACREAGDCAAHFRCHLSRGRASCSCHQGRCRLGTREAKVQQRPDNVTHHHEEDKSEKFREVFKLIQNGIQSLERS